MGRGEAGGDILLVLLTLTEVVVLGAGLRAHAATPPPPPIWTIIDRKGKARIPSRCFAIPSCVRHEEYVCIDAR